MQDCVKTYEAIENKVEAESVNVRTIEYWKRVKEDAFMEFNAVDYESYCYDVVNKIMEDEMHGRISGYVLLDLIKIGLPHYAEEKW
jgi:hypothetical protein